MGRDEKSDATFSHNEDGTVDEIFVSAKFVHIEQMSDNCYWMGITLPNDEFLHVNFWTPRTRIRMNYNEEGGLEGGEFGSGVMVPTDTTRVKREGA